jgi:hypothetical protein
MKATRFWRPATAFALLALLGSAHALTNPPIRMAQGIEYMCGGQSPAEAAFMETVAPRWAATLEFGVSHAKKGQFPGDVRIIVRERYTGRTVMELATAAPIMVARLDPGTYEVEATLAGLTLQEPLVVFNGMGAKAVFTWPSNIDFAGAMGLPTGEQQAAARIGD